MESIFHVLILALICMGCWRTSSGDGANDTPVAAPTDETVAATDSHFPSTNGGDATDGFDSGGETHPSTDTGVVVVGDTGTASEASIGEGDTSWLTFYGSADADYAAAMVSDSSDNIYVVGTSSASWNGPEGQESLHPHSGERDMFVLKVDSNGGYRWHTFIGSSGFDDGATIALDNEENPIVGGSCSTSWDGPNGEASSNPHSGGDRDLAVVKLDTEGAYQWHTFYGGSGGNELSMLLIDREGGIVVVGTSRQSWEGPEGRQPRYAYTDDDENVVLLQLSSGGAYQWHAFFGGGGSIYPSSITTDAMGNLVVAGIAYRQGWNGPAGETPLVPHQADQSLFVLKTSESGVYQWHTFYGSRECRGVAVLAKETGHYVVAGNATHPWDGPGGESPLYPHLNDDDDDDMFLLELDESGDYQWHAFYGGTRFDFVSSIILDAQGEITLLGSSNSAWDGPSGEAPLFSTYAGADDMTITTVNDAGTYEWHAFLGGDAHDRARAGAFDSTGHLVVAGTVEGPWDDRFGGAPLNPFNGEQEIVILKR